MIEGEEGEENTLQHHQESLTDGGMAQSGRILGYVPMTEFDGQVSGLYLLTYLLLVPSAFSYPDVPTDLFFIYDPHSAYCACVCVFLRFFCVGIILVVVSGWLVGGAMVTLLFFVISHFRVLFTFILVQVTLELILVKFGSI